MTDHPECSWLGPLLERGATLTGPIRDRAIGSHIPPPIFYEGCCEHS
jgi:hypothetical protein